MGRLSHMARRASGSNQEMQGSSVVRGGGGDGQIHKTGGALYGVLKRPGFCWLEGRKAFDVTASQILALSHIGAGVVFLASSRERFNTGISLTVDGGLDLVSGSSLRSQRLLQLFLIQSHFHVGDILLYVIRPSSCQVVQLLCVSAFYRP